jgi:bifunctional non-homologous end joining protein LigD
MLAKPDGGTLAAGPKIVYETKLDGYRCCYRVAADGTTVLTSRNDIDFTAEFAELTGVLAEALDGRPAVLDGEIVVYDERGRPDFGLLQERRGRYTRHHNSRLREEPFTDVPVRFLAFDLLLLGDRELRSQPYEQRRRLLTELPMPDPYRVAVVQAVSFDELAADRRTPQDLLDQVAAAGHEGLIAKTRTGLYLPGKRSEARLKHPLIHTTEVVVAGWRPGQRGFAGTLGGLLLGAHDPDTGRLVYLGDVGTGFSQAERAQLLARLAEIERRTHPFAQAPPREDMLRARWVDPALVGEVVFRQFTRAPQRRLRHTAWRGLRADRTPEEVLLPTAPGDTPATPDPPNGDQPVVARDRVVVQVADRQLTLTNLSKPLYPDGFSKAEVIDYYTRIAPVLLAHLRDRPVTFVRWPDGVAGQSWFEKNLPRGAPGWLRTVRLPSSGSRGSGEVIEYPLLDDLPALVWAANLAALELHVPQWRIGPDGSRGLPDRLVFDLDPGPGATIVDCCRVAARLQEILRGDGLTAAPKTSGSKGMQLYAGITVDRPDAPSEYAKRLAQQLARETPDAVTAVMSKAQRTGKVFIDWSQNNPAKTTIAPYSLRGRDQPTVSTPITWEEVRTCRAPEDLIFTAPDVLDRVDELGDLLADLHRHRPPLPPR